MPRYLLKVTKVEKIRREYRDEQTGYYVTNYHRDPKIEALDVRFEAEDDIQADKKAAEIIRGHQSRDWSVGGQLARMIS